MLKSKNKCDFVIPILKVLETKFQGFFDLSNFYLLKLILEPLTLKPQLSSRLRSWGSRLWSESLDLKCSNDNFFN